MQRRKRVAFGKGLDLVELCHMGGRTGEQKSRSCQVFSIYGQSPEQEHSLPGPLSQPAVCRITPVCQVQLNRVTSSTAVREDMCVPQAAFRACRVLPSSWQDSRGRDTCCHTAARHWPTHWKPPGAAPERTRRPPCPAAWRSVPTAAHRPLEGRRGHAGQTSISAPPGSLSSALVLGWFVPPNFTPSALSPPRRH